MSLEDHRAPGDEHDRPSPNEPRKRDREPQPVLDQARQERDDRECPDLRVATMPKRIEDRLA